MKLEMSIVQNEEKRILELIPQATKVDIVSAWVTPTASFKELVRRAKEQVQDNIFFQLVVGTSSGGTDPRVFSILKNLLGASCKVPSQDLRKTGIFHPKLYIFHGVEGEDIVLVGSMNFTNAGLHKNKELLIELRGDVSELKKWFKDIWSNSGLITEEELEQCQKAWDNRINKNGDPGEQPADEGSTLVMKKNIFSSWRKYKKALEDRAAILAPRMSDQEEESVLGVNDIWTNVICAAQEVLESRHWDQESGRILAGNMDPYKPLGTMGGNGEFCGVMVNSRDPAQRDAIRKILRKFKNRKVSHLTAEKRAEVVCSYLSKLLQLDSVGISAATRLLTLTRPDLAFSYNGSSSKNLHILGGIPTDSRTELNYKKLLEEFYSTEWYRSKEPKYPKRDNLIWKCRMALIDLLVYEHNNVTSDI